MSKNSNKKAKWIIPFAVLSLTCASAGIMAGCNPTEEHTHSYEWKYSDTEHWKECPDDHDEEEGTRGEHVFVAGECECGKQEPVAEKKYGKVKGTVKLHKQGKYETDFTGVTVDMGDDVKPVLNTQTGELTVDKVEVGKKYSLTVSKEGYKPYSLTVNVPSEGQEVTVGGTRGIVLEYQAYSVIIYDEELHDFSNINDENPTIKVNGNGGKSLDIISRDTYGDVSLTIETKASNGGVVQGVLLKFEDGKYAMLNIKTDQDLIQYRPDFWGMNSIFGETQWVESEKGSVTAADKDKFNGDGVVLNLVRKGGKLIAFVDGRFVLETSLPEGYEDDKVQVGFFSFDVKQNAEWAIGVSETLPALETALDINVTNPEDGTECSVTAVPEKDKYALGEEIELTFTAPEHYQLSALTVNGVDKYTAVENGKLTVLADRATVEVNATFAKEQPVALSLTVKGKKLGKTANLAEGTEVRLSGISTPFTVGADGKITGNVMKGRYTVSVDGYFTKEVAVDDELTETVLEYDTFQQILGWGSFNFDDQNAESPKVGITNDCAVVLTKDTYGSGVMSSLYLKGENMNAGNGGIVFRFVGEGMAANGENIYFVMKGTTKVQVAKDNLWGKTTVADGVEWNNLIYFVEGEDDNAYRYADEHAEEYLEDYANGELKLSVLREESTFYVYLNGRYVGKHTIADKYKNARCEVGFMAGDLGNASDWKYWNVAIDENVQREAITVNDKTAANAGGTIEIAPETVRLGDTVTITVKPDSSHIFENLTVSDGITPVRQQDGTYTFVATKTGIDVTATFAVKPATGAEADVSGIGLGNAPVTFADGTVVTFTPAEGAPVTLEVEGGRISGALLAGTYTATVEGYYGVEVTVGTDGAFEDLTGGLKFEKVVFVTNRINEPVKNIFGEGNEAIWSADNKHAASTGKIVAKQTGKMYEWTEEEYGDVAFSVTLKSGNGNQGIIMRFGGEQKDVRLRFENSKAQWMSGGWWWGSFPIIDDWNAAGDFGSGEAYANNMSDALLEKYNGEGLTLTMLRKGGMVYAIIDGQVYSALNLADGYASKTVRICYFAEGSTEGYEVPFTLNSDVNAVLAAATDANGVMGALGKWTSTETTLAVNGKGYAELAPASDATKESLAVTLKDGNSTAGKKAQGVVYNFADGKWIAARMESSDAETYIQYSDDMLISKVGGSLTSWVLVKNFDKSLLTDGVSLKMVRDGRNIYVLLGGEVIDLRVLDEKYAAMDGVFAATIDGGTGTPFAYEYKSGDDVTIPAAYRVAATVDGEAHGYDVSLNKSFVKNGESVTLTVKTNASWWNAWSYFPSSVKVNGVEKFVAADMVSDSANHLTYTLTIENVTEATEIVVKVTQGVKVAYDASVNNSEYGSVVCDMENDENDPCGYYWNDGCTWTITANDGYVLEKIVLGEGANAQTITEGWTANGNVYTYNHKVTGDIKAVMHFKAAEA